MIERYLPSVSWLKDYKKEYLSADILAGLTVGVMLVPQGLAYALLAGLPPIFGLYAALVPQIIYVFLGTSRQLGVGPVAMDSLLVAAGLGALSLSGIDEYISMAIFLSLFMGSIQLCLGFLKMGFVVNFLSKPVISGFTSAAAIIIGLNQVKHLFGINVHGSNRIHELLLSILDHISEINYISIAIGICGILIIFFLKKYKPVWPGALIAVLISILLVYLFKLEEGGLAIVGEVPDGLPSFTFPEVSLSRISSLFPLALTLAIIAYMESVSVAKTLETRHQDYKIDSNQELIALGASNVIGSFFQSYPTTGGFSRSALYEQLGNKTGVAALMSALVVGLTLLFLTPVFYNLPTSILAAIIIVAVTNLVDYTYAKSLWKISKTEFYLLFITFLFTLFVGIIQGILIGVIVSLFMLIYRVSHPHVAVLGQIPNQPQYRNVHRFENLILRQDMLILRIDAQLYFANLNYISEFIDQKLGNSSSIRHVILDASAINFIDTSGIEMLKKLYADLVLRDISLYLVEVRGPIRDLMHKNYMLDKANGIKLFMSIEDAVSSIENPQFYSEKDTYIYESNK